MVRLLMIFIMTNLFIVSSYCATKKSNLFYVERNKNKNQVQYQAIYEDKCLFKNNEIVTGYWKELEKGKDVVSDLSIFDKVAYGIVDQKIMDKGTRVDFTLKPLKAMKMKAVIKEVKKDECKVEALIMVDKKWVVLEKVYVFAKSGFVMPTVKYIDIFGKLPDGKEFTKRLDPDKIKK